VSEDRAIRGIVIGLALSLPFWIVLGLIVAAL